MPRKLVGLLAVICSLFLGMGVMWCYQQLKRTNSTKGLKLSPEALKTSKGQPAPALEGMDMDGQLMKLSDFKGRVIVIDFWGLWSDESKKRLPHHQQLVERMKGRPFVFLGVNTDTHREEVNQHMIRNKLTWRNWLDGKPGGPIQLDWNMKQPGNFVIDSRGIIRFTNVFGSELDNAVDQLLGER